MCEQKLSCSCAVAISSTDISSNMGRPKLEWGGSQRVLLGPYLIALLICVPRRFDAALEFFCDHVCNVVWVAR